MNLDNVESLEFYPAKTAYIRSTFRTWCLICFAPFQAYHSFHLPIPADTAFVTLAAIGMPRYLDRPSSCHTNGLSVDGLVVASYVLDI